MPTASFSLQIGVAPAYELLLSLGVMSDTPGRHAYELDNSWFEQARKAASPALLQQIDAFSGTDMLWAHLLSLAYEALVPGDVPAFLKHVEQTDAEEVRLRFLGYYVRHLRRLTPPDVIAAAAAGDSRAQAEFLRTSQPTDEGWQQALRAVLPLGAEETKYRLLEIARGWHEQVFRAQEASVMPIVERDAERKEALLRTSTPERLLQLALPGYDYLPEPGIRHVLLIPSWFVRPQIYVLDHAETKIFACGVDEETLRAGADVPSPRLLRLAKALGDERRLRILKRLTAGDRTLHELAVAFGVSDTTMLHHLIILRGARLIRVQGGSGKRYRLQRDVLPEMGHLLAEYLTAEEGDVAHTP